MRQFIRLFSKSDCYSYFVIFLDTRVVIDDSIVIGDLNALNKDFNTHDFISPL